MLSYKNMDLKPLLLQEFDSEMAITKKILERVPMEKADWVPHEKSRPLGALAVHVATVSRFVEVVLVNGSFEVGKSTPREVKTSAELMALFEEFTSKARALIEKTNNDELMKPFELRMNGKVFGTMPRAIAFRTLFMRHLIHHRAQLGMYLRLNDVAVPGTYGPTADEQVR